MPRTWRPRGRIDTIRVMRSDVAAATLLAVLAGATAGATTWVHRTWLPPGRALPGLYVGGKLQPADERLGDWLERRRADVASTAAWVSTPQGLLPATFGDLGIELDVGATMDAAMAQARDGSLGSRLARAWRARQGDVDVPLAFRFDPGRATAWLAAAEPDVYVEPIDARLDLVRHERVADVPGVRLDVPATVSRIADGERGEDAVFVAALAEVPATVTERMLADVDVTQVLAAFETDFGGTGEGRATNIRRGAELLNGTVIAPGQVVSFNQLVGPRRLDRGFVWAPVIVRDELEPGVGGGTCQVASTLHAAAVYGLLEVVERRSHSRPSSYAPLGLDATVIYGEVDLKLKNTYSVPLILHAFLPSRTKLRVEVLGAPAPGKVQYQYAVTKVEDFYRRITTKPWLSPERRLRRQKGIKGYDVVSVVRTTSSAGTVLERRYRSAYRPVPEVFWVGPGHDLTSLPELPEGASRVEFELLDPPSGSSTGG